MRGFLVARFIAMLGWVAILAAGHLSYRGIAPLIDNDFARWLVNLLTLGLTIGGGLALQRKALHWLDPDGELRRAVREEAESARRAP